MKASRLFNQGDRATSRRGVSGSTRPSQSLTPRLRPLSLAISAAFLLMTAVTLGLIVGLAGLLGVPLTVLPGDVDSARVSVEIVKIALGFTAAAGALVALVVAYRRQLLQEVDSYRSDQRVFTERYEAAAQQLGHEQAAVRLAGVHALARLADDWLEQRQTCVAVLCAYYRMPYSPTEAPPGEREVRLTVMRSVRDHLLREADPSWRGLDFDFRGATLDRADLSEIVLDDGGSMLFEEARFEGPLTSFDGALIGRSRVSFDRAKFAGGEVSFSKVVGLGRLSFIGARFEAGQVFFAETVFHEPCAALFVGARFAGSHLLFGNAVFKGGTVSFAAASVSAGLIAFMAADIENGLLDFSGTTFSGGAVGFGSATTTLPFPGLGVTHQFPGARLVGGRITFRRARFIGGLVTFEGAVFGDTEVDLREAADWSVPPLGVSPPASPRVLLPPEEEEKEEEDQASI